MAEHYTQGRQGQGARRRRHNNRNNNRRHRMPRPEAAPAKKPSLLSRVLSFFGFGKKKDAKADRKPEKKQQGDNRRQGKAPENVRIAKGRANQTGNPAARGKRRATSVPPTKNSRLYVGNLSYEATESELEDLFKGFGHVRSVEVIYNPRTYKSKGYAFVEMVNMDDAKRAAEVLHGQPFMGRELMVSAASEKAERPETDNEPAAKPAETPAPAEAPAASEPAPAETPAEPAAEQA